MSLTPTDIVKHLKEYLPRYTNAFTEQLTVTGAIMGANNELTITSIAHGKAPGTNIVITAGTTRNTLTAAVLEVDDTVTFTTVADHDLTRPILIDDTKTLTLAGFGSVWDGEHDIIDVQNRRNFNVNLPTGETLAPALDGNQYLIEDLARGVFPIDTVPTADTFTIDMSAYPSMPANTIDNISVLSGFRIASAANFKRAQEAYSKQGADEPYLFVIMTDTDVSKDRHTLNDGVAGLTAQDQRLLRLLQNFSTSVFIPTTEDLSGAYAQDTAYGEINMALITVLFGAPFYTDSAIKYLTVPVGHGPGEYNTAYYVHVWDWQAPTVIDYRNGFLEQDIAAFRDMEQRLQLLADQEAEMLSNINLDEEPL